MHDYDFEKIPERLLSPEIVKAIAALHEHKGKQDLFLEANVDDLKSLLEIAKIQSTGASNRIEGIYTSDKRLEELVTKKTEPRNRSEEEISGYREVLTIIHESYDYIEPRPNMILQLHKTLYSYSDSTSGGQYKNSDNVITETDSRGNTKIRFVPVSAWQTADAMEKLCSSFQKAWNEDRFDKILLIPMFVLDFLCIHPFNDGNGRMSRLLTLLLLYRAGYIVGKYISIEMLIEKTKETYYEALESSSLYWQENKNNYTSFVRYYLGILGRAYGEFENRVHLLQDRRLSKPERIRKLIDSRIGTITKREIMEICPDISKITVERALSGFVKSGYLEKVGNGPTSAYIRKQGNR